MRLIDAEDLYSRFENEYKLSHKKAMATLSDYWRGICDGIDWGCLRLIKAPTIEEEPVRHGEWKFDPEAWEWNCSECHNWKEDGCMDRSVLSNYCPNCGAKMDGGAEYEKNYH